MNARRISRRTILRGTGAAMALPWLETMAHAAPADTATRCLSRRCAWSACTCRTASARITGHLQAMARDYEITPHLKPLEEPEGRFPASGESLERQDRRPQWPLAEGAGVPLRRLRGANLGRRSGFRRYLRRSVAAQHIGDRTRCPASNSASNQPVPASIPRAAASPACTARSSPGAIRTRPSPKRSCRSSPSTVSSAPIRRR